MEVYSKNKLTQQHFPEHPSTSTLPYLCCPQYFFSAKRGSLLLAKSQGAKTEAIQRYESFSSPRTRLLKPTVSPLSCSDMRYRWTLDYKKIASCKSTFCPCHSHKTEPGLLTIVIQSTCPSCMPYGACSEHKAYLVSLCCRLNLKFKGTLFIASTIRTLQTHPHCRTTIQSRLAKYCSSLSTRYAHRCHQ